MDNTSEQKLFLNRYVFGAHVAEGGSAKIFKVIDTWFPDRKLIAKVQRDDDPDSVGLYSASMPRS